MLKNTDCTFGTVVGFDDKILPVRLGTIAGPVSNHPSLGEVVVVEWTGGYLQKIALRSLISEEEANRLQVELQAAKDKLEAEFQVVAKEVAKKLEEAAKLIEEAGNAATKAGKDLSSDFYRETHQLENAMERAGWRTSSWHC